VRPKPKPIGAFFISAAMEASIPGNGLGRLEYQCVLEGIRNKSILKFTWSLWAFRQRNPHGGKRAGTPIKHFDRRRAITFFQSLGDFPKLSCNVQKFF
jgi:hypothetical protein